MFRLVRNLVLIFIIGIGIVKIFEIELVSNPIQRFLKGPDAEVRDTMAINLIQDPTNLLVLVNKQNSLEDDFKPSDLIVPNVPFSSGATEEERHLHKEAAQALEKLFQGASDSGYRLIATSGYRSYETQKNLYEDFVKQLGLEAAEYRAAQPGNSEHQTGLAMDITSSGFNYEQYNDFGETPGGKWVANHAYQFGFIIRYPEGKEHITGYQYEPWHLRYVGVEQATYIFNHNLTFEEYRGAI